MAAAMADDELHVVVVGGGLAGLSAAASLLEFSAGGPHPRDVLASVDAHTHTLTPTPLASPATGNSDRRTRLRVTVLEAADRVGGRTCSRPCGMHSGVVIDTGGQWLGAHQHAALALAAQQGVVLHPQYCTGRRVLQYGANVITYSGLIPGLSVGQLLDVQITLILLHCIEFLAFLLRACFGNNNCLTRTLDAMTVDEMTARLMWTDAGRALVRIIVQALFGAEPSALSMHAFFEYVRASGSIEAMTEIGPGSVQAYTMIGGAQQLSIGLSERVTRAGGVLRLNARVRECRYRGAPSADGHLCEVVLDSGETLPCDAVLVAVPAATAGVIGFSPELPAHRLALLADATMGGIIKAIVVYSSAFWRDAGFSGEVVCDTASHPDGGPAFNVFDGCTPVDPAVLARQPMPPDVQLVPYVDPVTRVSKQLMPALVVFINGERARSFSGRDSEERKAAVLRQLALWFGPRALQPLDYIEKDWVTDPFTRGCPISSYNRSILSRYGLARSLSEPCWRSGSGTPHLFWAGTETSPVDTGFMSGALRSGWTAAAAILAQHEALRRERGQAPVHTSDSAAVPLPQRSAAETGAPKEPSGFAEPLLA